MSKALVFVSVATSLVATALALCERRRRKEAEKHATYFYDELFRPTEDEFFRERARTSTLEDIVCEAHGHSPWRVDYE